MRITEATQTFPSCRRGKAIEVIVNGQKAQAFEGELVSTVLQELGISIYGCKPKTGRGSGLYCGMGVCYECLVTIDKIDNVQACQTFAVDQMVIETNRENQ